MRLGLVSALLIGLAACNATAREKNQKTGKEPTKAELEMLVTTEPVRKDWERGIEHFLELAGLKADRYEWAATKGSDWHMQAGMIGPRGVVHSGLWVGCGWAHYSELPKGIKFSPARVAIKLDKDDGETYAIFAWSAHKLCRFAPGPTLADGSKVKRSPYVSRGTDGAKTLETSSGWVRVRTAADALLSIEIQAGLTDEQARDVFAVLNKKSSNARLDKVTIRSRQ